ncbi:Pyroglutamyl-peptidase 1 [Chaetomidium leptoderma]|uniref:Pyroglutamyl-peptidase 1 n=1 Tax=Chaetomidium leptoderma TaxID=669021 RepID=A0AAN6VUY5_9PEZI|nr:Pyroglutamyl-peptidase 1 [Chaetomidium leptoderma]
MGSVGADSSEQEPITVLITGFAPFKKDYPVNPSWEIAHSLPEWLPPLRAKTTTTTPGRVIPTTPPVRLVVHPDPIRVNYTTVRDLVPALWYHHQQQPPQAPPKIDMALHIGMAGPRLFYALERRGHRDGYAMPDVDGAFVREDDARRERAGEGRVWEGLPEVLESGFDVEDVLGRWRRGCPKHLDLRISEDAGHYMCDFIYFSSLAHLYKAGEERKVLFLHVPSDASERSIEVGRELVLQLVRAMVESEMVQRGKPDETR